MYYAHTIIPLRCIDLMQRGGIVIFEGIDKKDAEALKTASSPYRRTAETVFGGKKSENVILSFEVIRKDSCHTETGRDKIVWSVRFRHARRTIVRRAAKSGAEKADNYFFGEIR